MKGIKKQHLPTKVCKTCGRRSPGARNGKRFGRRCNIAVRNAKGRWHVKH